jgi:fibronectin-binding autotransporter adhesin
MPPKEKITITQRGLQIKVPAILNPDQTLTLNNTADIKITGAGGFSGNLTKTGSTNLRLSHSGGFNGTLSINNQFVTLGSAAADPVGQTSNQTKVAIASGASLILGSAYNDATGTIKATIGELSGAGIVRTDWTDGGTNAMRTLKVDQSTASTFSGTFSQASSGRIIGFEKAGSGVLTISNNAALSGITGSVAVSGGTLKVSGSTNTPLNNTGSLSISSGATFEAANSTTGIPAGITKTISGSGTFLRNGSGNLVISGTNNSGFNGSWKATSGTFGFNSETSMGGANVTLDGGGIFMNGNGVGISSSKTITLGAGGGFFDGSTSWTQTWSATVTGTGNLTKRSGMLHILDGNNDYAGTTTVQSGTLRINGIHTGTGDVNVDGGTRLEGTGSVAGAINVSGVLAPGASIESFGSGNVSFTTGSTFAYELDSASINGDLLDSTGLLDIAAGTTLTLTELASGILAEGSKLTLISYAGGWVNTELFTYLGSSLADDSTFTLGSNIWLFNYNDNSGGSNFTSDQTGASSFVTMTVVPEPAAALLGGIGMLILLRRRRAA